MIQFNLLPDVKLEYTKATYKRRIITLFSLIIAGAFLTIFVLMFLFVRVNQTRHLNNLDSDINTKVAELRDKNPDLDKILTIQNQLNSLPALHDKKLMSSRLFDYLTQITPNQALISSVDMDDSAKTIVIKGTADSIVTINKFVDTVKFTDYKVKNDETKQGKAFSSVVLQSFNIDSEDGTGDPRLAVSFEINFTYDPVIFVGTAKEGSAVNNEVVLTVPKIITTRSELQKPSDDLFQATPETEGTEGN